MTATEPIETSAFEQMDPDEAQIEQVAPDEIPVHPVELVMPTPTAGLPEYEQGQKLIPGTSLPIVPQVNELDVLAQMAVTIAGSATAPKALQGKPNDAFMVLLTGRDLGVALTTALREFHVIDGRVTISPKAKMAMIRARGLGRVWPDPGNDEESATWYGERADMPGVIVASTYTMEMAKRVPRLTEKDNWKNYPERMLSWRSGGYLTDDLFSDVATGLYSPDELGAVTDEDGEPIIDVVAAASPVRGTKGPAGHNAPPPPLLSDEQREGLQARIDKIGAFSADARQALLALWTHREGNDQPRLPPLGKVLLRQFAVADGLVKSIEARVKKGEWGEYVEPQALEGDQAPDVAAEPESVPDVAPDPAEAPAVEQPPVEDEKAVENAIVAEVNDLTPEAVALRLTALDLSTSGTHKQIRLRLAKALVAQARGETLPLDPQ